MNKIRIQHVRHPLYDSFKALYSVSFPIFEQRTEAQQEYAFLSANYHLMAYEENTVFIGFIAYWEFDAYVYIEHCAIDRGLRGQGYGRRLLSGFIEECPKRVLLEIDPVVDEVSRARLAFYKKCGFHENDHPHFHPPYRNEYKAHPLTILTTGRSISDEEYDTFSRDLNETVMRF